jgi:hypothetical protein
MKEYKMDQFDTPQPTRSYTFRSEPGPDDLNDAIRELDQRINDGVTVTLLWNAATNRVFVSVVEAQHGVSFEFAVPAAEAADAFHHPYAYAAPDQEGDALAA